MRGEKKVNELETQGWTRRNVACEPRLGESVNLYEELGLEVLLVPLLEDCAGSEGESGCTSCIENDADPDKYKVIYTKLRHQTTG